MTMPQFMASRIELAGETSLEAARQKYYNYFIRTSIYVRLGYKEPCDEILIADGHEDYIVES